jgi:UDP-3-O-[3-hydroxymyristoyl] glucosamine N-acyltransferase
MQLTDLIIVGAGNPDIVKLVDDINSQKMTYNLIGFLEKDESLYGHKLCDYDIIGSDELLKTAFSKCAVVNNVWGSSSIRKNLTNKIISYGINTFPNMIHPTVNLKYFSHGIGNIIYDNVTLGGNVIIGNFNIIFYGSVLGHQAVLGDYNLIGGHVMIGSRSNISTGVIVSNSCTISNGLTICDDVFIGVGSVVVGSINKSKKVFGNPAREMITINNH